jgi:hypothetical protein
MKRFAGIGVIALSLLVAGTYYWKKRQDDELRQDLEARRAAAQEDFSKSVRNALARTDDAGSLNGLREAIEVYQAALSEDIFRGHDEFREVDQYRQRVDEQASKKSLTEERKAKLLEGFEMVKQAYDTLVADKWSPALVQRGLGPTRLDVYDVRREEVDGRPHLAARFFLWGVNPATQIHFGRQVWHYWTKLDLDGKELEKPRVLGRAEGPAQPAVLIQNPQTYVREFPPAVAIGVLMFPLVPDKATAFDLEFMYELTMDGKTHPVALRWPDHEVPAGWALKEGEAWDAQVVEASDEEIAGETLRPAP